MSDPRRLLAQGADDFERALLRAAQDDRPAHDRRGVLLASLGLPTVVSNTAAASGGASVAGAGAKAGVTVLVKWVGVASVAAVATAGTVGVVQSSSREHASHAAVVERASHLAAATVTAAPRSPPREIEPAPVVQPPEAVATEAAEPAPPVVTRAPSPPRAPLPQAPAKAAPAPADGSTAPAQVPSPVPRSNPLGDEIAALDVARAALRTHRPADALVALDAYENRFIVGALRPEAVVVRIEALLALGRQEQARQLAHDFLAAHPESPLAARVRSMLDP
jgi:hypothetical protein